MNNRDQLIKDSPSRGVLFYNPPLQSKYKTLVDSGFLKAIQGPATENDIEKYAKNTLLIFDVCRYYISIHS